MFTYVPPEDLSGNWVFVEHGLNEVLSITKEDWTPADVRRHLRFGRAALYVRDDGFVILERCLEPISGEPYLNVWIAWFEPGKAKAIRKEFIDWLDGAKQHSKCEWIQFASPRDGWAGLEPDFERAQTIWRRK